MAPLPPCGTVRALGTIDVPIALLPVTGEAAAERIGSGILREDALPVCRAYDALRFYLRSEVAGISL
jgi:hypothetical protein